MKPQPLAAILALGCGIAWAAGEPTPTPHLQPIAPAAAQTNAAAPGNTAPGDTATDGTKTGAAPDAGEASADGSLRVTKFAPLAYFNEKCARCHGKYGSFYGDDFAKNLDDAALHNVVEQMANGPAQAPLSPAELEAETAWHRALRDGKPFVAIVKSEKTGDGWQLSGEVSPGATLEINGKPVEITKKSDWTALVAPGAVKLIAKKGEATTELNAQIAALAP